MPPVTPITTDDNTRHVTTDAALLRALASQIEASGRPLSSQLRETLRQTFLGHTATPTEIHNQICIRCGFRHDVDQSFCYLQR